MAKRNHAYLVNACLLVLELRKMLAWKSNTGAARIGKRFVRFGVKGVPDIIAIAPGGKFLGVECKVGRDRLRPEQIDFRDRIIAAGGAYVLVRDNVDDLLKILDAQNTEGIRQ